MKPTRTSKRAVKDFEKDFKAFLLLFEKRWNQAYKTGEVSHAKLANTVYDGDEVDKAFAVLKETARSVDALAHIKILRKR